MLAAIDRALPVGVVADYATGSERRPPRRGRDLANHPTLVAPGDPEADAAGTEAVAASARRAAPSRWWPRAVTGAGLGLITAAAIVAAWAGHAGTPVASPVVVSGPSVAPAVPAAVAPAPVAATPARPV